MKNVVEKARVGTLEVESRRTIPPGYVETLRGRAPDAHVQVFAEERGVELVAVPVLLKPREARELAALLQRAADRADEAWNEAAREMARRR
jgi:hypothetical protein